MRSPDTFEIAGAAMEQAPQLLLIAAVAAVGVFHTMVPDHWVPITLMARQRGWSSAETARGALVAGTGHVVSTLVIAVIFWAAGAALADRVGELVDRLAGVALVAFGGWIAIAAWRELHPARPHRHDHDGHHHHHHHTDRHGEATEGSGQPAIEADPLYAPLRSAPAEMRHRHLHRHRGTAAHLHWHDHTPATAHAVAIDDTWPPRHEHRHKTTARNALLLILGSSPMVEGIPAFFAAGRYGAGLVAAMAAVFAFATIATYVVLCVASTSGLQRVRLGPVERYGEVLSGALIAAVGLVFSLWPGF
jgi:ABC-type nickel/cobalt efflux system permease component RcnA